MDASRRIWGRAGSAVLAASPLVWIFQAAMLARAVQRLAEGGGLAEVLVPATAFLLAGVLRAVAEAWATRQVFRAARAHLSALRSDTLAALAARSPLDRARPASGLAAGALAEQAEALMPWLTRYQPARQRAMLVPAVIAGVVATQSWLAALILLAAAPLIPFFMAVIGWRAKALSEQQWQALGGMNGFLLDRLRGLSTLRALGAVDATATRLRATAEALRASTMRVLRIAFLSSAALELFSALGVALVAVYIGFHLLGQLSPGTWGAPLTLGQGLFILLLAPTFFEPLRELSAAWHDKAAGEAALTVMADLRTGALPLPGALARSAEDAAGSASAVQPVGAAARGAGVAPAVSVEALHFAHPGEAPVFTEAALHVGAGEHVALVGASGAGKSTLLAIIAGLVPVTEGRVRIGDVSLDDAQAPALRGRMAWVGQHAHVFQGSVRSNIRLGRPEVPEIAVTAALHRAALGSVGQAVADGPLGEGGIGLSGGERVRLALARAAASPTATLLLADEPTAHLDRETAQEVTEALLRLAEGRTLILATHDLTLARRVGRIVRVGEGRIDASTLDPRAAGRCGPSSTRYVA